MSRKSYLAPHLRPMLEAPRQHLHSCNHSDSCGDREAMGCRSCRSRAFNEYMASLSTAELIERRG